jgi:hypothetical protein
MEASGFGTNRVLDPNEETLTARLPVSQFRISKS